MRHISATRSRLLILVVVVALAAAALAPASATASDGFGTYKGRWSGPGAGFGRSYGMAFSAVNGRLYVTDYSNNCVYIYEPDGTLVSQFGAWGWGTGQFRQPWGIVVHPTTGKVYVMDNANNRIQVFSASGVYEAAWTGVTGTDLAWNIDYTQIYAYDPGADTIHVVGLSTGTVVDNHVLPSSGMGYHIATDPSTGDLYLGDWWSGYNAIRRYSTTTWTQIGSKTYWNAYGVFVHPATGYLIAGNRTTAQVQSFSADLATTYGTFGSSGTTAGKFTFIEAVTVNPANGDIYVFDSADTASDRYISYFTGYPTYKEIVPDGFSGVAKVTVPGSDSMSSATARTLYGFPGLVPFRNVRVARMVDITPNVAPGSSATVTLSYPSSLSSAEEGTVGLYHLVDSSWVEITTSVDTAANTVSGTTSSFSPFAVLYEPSSSSVPASSEWSVALLALAGIAVIGVVSRRRARA